MGFELEEVIHLGGGVVFAVVSQDGRPVGGDGNVRQRKGWVYLCVGGFPEADPLRGRDEYRSWLEEANSAWISARNDTIEAFALGRDRVIHRGEWGGKGAASGIETVSSVTSIYTIRGDLTARIEYYFDDEQALKAVGLSE